MLLASFMCALPFLVPWRNLKCVILLEWHLRRVKVATFQKVVLTTAAGIWTEFVRSSEMYPVGYQDTIFDLHLTPGRYALGAQDMAGFVQSTDLFGGMLCTFFNQRLFSEARIYTW